MQHNFLKKLTTSSVSENMENLTYCFEERKLVKTLWEKV